MDQSYDYIIAGAGAAGLSLAWRMLQSPLKHKKVLIIDADLAPVNDKTWCFWHAGHPPFADILRKKWNQIEIGLPEERLTQRLSEYPYYALRSVDLQKKVLAAIGQNPNYRLLEKAVSHFETNPDEQQATVHTGDEIFRASYIFQSCLNPFEKKAAGIRYPLLQHFLGWEITANRPVFDPSTCTLMDFDETFTDGVGFMYLLPWSRSSGLVEYTIFSDQPEDEQVYAEKIGLYLHNRFQLKSIDYQLDRREYGVIPMQDRPFTSRLMPRVLNIGMQGGLTKPSTGYTFMRIQQQTQSLVEQLEAGEQPVLSNPSDFRFKAYDLWLLHILYHCPRKGLEVLCHLFRNNPVDNVFRFLNEDSTFLQDLSIMSSVPYRPFLQAIWRSRSRLKELGRFFNGEKGITPG